VPLAPALLALHCQPLRSLVHDEDNHEDEHPSTTRTGPPAVASHPRVTGIFPPAAIEDARTR